VRLALAALGLLVAGCSMSPSIRTVTAPASPLARAQATHEYPAPAVSEQVASPSANAAAAVRRFAGAYINWNAGDVSAQMGALAQQSLGQARSALELAAAQTEQDYELQRGGVANQGTVEAVVALTGHPDQFIVVTRERTTATNTSAYQGLAPAWHVALATVSQVSPGHWAVSAWQPES
jgi:hypothetical protein